MDISDWIQFMAVLVALAASVSALGIATADRKNQLRIARASREQSRLTLELEYAIRLSTNRNMGGSVDPAESKRLGTEALALASVVGERWVPMQFNRAMSGKSAGEMRQMLQTEDSDTPQWVKDKIESGLAVQEIIKVLYANSPQQD